ncbi:MAG TPA: site-specific integrase, partial [Kofleriaceae bacterium]|nr:site-specific integrase [Kofleriaceae bacterium]
MRRDYQLVVLLSGLRRMDAATIRWEHVDFAARTLRRPNPKGGADRAFTFPLSRACIEILEQRKRENRDDNGWAFPTDAMIGRACDLCAELGLPRHRVGARIHLVEAKEAADEIVSPHRLRDTYTSALAEVGGIYPTLESATRSSSSTGAARSGSPRSRCRTWQAPSWRTVTSGPRSST